MNQKECECGGTEFVVELRDAETEIYFKCVKCGKLEKVELIDKGLDKPPSSD